MNAPLPILHYPNLLALADLPYFARQDDRLVLKDKSVGPIIDMHTHLAMAFVRPHQFGG